MKEFITRTISGFVFVFILVSTILAHEISFLFIFLVILVFSLSEYYNLLYRLKFHPYKFMGILLAAILYILNFSVAAGMLETRILLINIPVLAGIGIFPLFYSPKTFSQSWISTISGWIYILLPLSLIPFIAFKDNSFQPELVLAVFIIIWIYDSLAYINGVLFGKHRMFPEVSPKKSWEGFAGGLILTMAAAYCMQWFYSFFSGFEWLLFSLIIIIPATAGDFLASALKRNAGVKDSGTLMPGHGGFIDRFDSFFLSVPFIFTFIILILN